MKINNIIYNILKEQNVLKTTKTKPIVDAIKNKYPISFFYTGPRSPKKDSVKPGKRIKAEIVAMGLSKKGNLIVRGFVQPPSVSKKGFDKHGWRTFMVSRMNNVEIHGNENFTIKRNKYREGDDGSMTVTYVTSDWVKQPKIKKTTTKVVPATKKVGKQVTKPEVKPEPIKPEPEDIKTKDLDTELPEPKPEVKPEPIMAEPTVDGDNNDNELPEPKPEDKPNENPDDEDKNLQEMKKRFKSLICY